MTKVWLFNTTPSHWDRCVKGPETGEHPERHHGHPWHGMPPSPSGPDPSELATGDLLIIRVNGEGVRGLWRFEEARRVADQSIIPREWSDQDYEWIIYCRGEPVLEFDETIEENFYESPDISRGVLAGTAKKTDSVTQPYVEFLLEKDIPRAARLALLDVSHQTAARSSQEMGGGDWTREEHILALDLYLNHPDIAHSLSDPAVQDLAELTGRSAGSISSRLGNYEYYDPDGTGGMDGGSDYCGEIWDEFYGHEDELAYEAERIREELTGGDVSRSTSSSTTSDVSGTETVETGETKGGGKSRIGQDKFRAALRRRYEDQCVLCDVSKPMLLEAAHILTWGSSEEERGDPANGLLLCRNHHEAFERGLFTLSDEYTMITRPDLSFESEWLKSTLTDRVGEAIDFPNEPPSSEYIRRHNRRLSWISDEDSE